MARRGFESVAGSEQLFRFDDCCAVYLLKQGERGILIDLGSGAALDHLKSARVTELEAVFFTHAHRDQCQGAGKAAARGVPLKFPQASREIVDTAQRRDFRAPSPLVGVYPGQFEPPHPLAEALYDVKAGGRVMWSGGELEVLAIPGHSPDQVAYLTDGIDLRAALCGDAMHSPGKIHEPYHLETDHYTGTGCRQAVESLRALKNARPAALCPSHGPVTMGDTWQALDETSLALLHLADLKDTNCPRRPAVPRLVPPHSNRLMQLSEHLLLWNNSYFLLSQEGPVLMVDCGEPLSADFHTQWRDTVGERTVEVVLLTHIHCDHVDGIGELRDAGGVLGRLQGPGARGRGATTTGDSFEVWALKGLAPLLARPHAFRRPYLPKEAVAVDRALPELGEVEWRGYQLHAFDCPGQTDLHALYATAVDGRRVVFSGDNFYPPQQWGGTGGLCGLNGGHPVSGWQASIRLLLELQPDWLLAAHVQPFPYRRSDFEAMLGWSEAAAEAMRALAPDGCLERHHDPHLIELLPYSQPLQGETVTVTARVRNPYPNPIQVDLALVLPSGWSLARTHRRLTAPAGGTVEATWSPTVSDPPPADASMFAVDVVYEGDYLGQKAECYVFRC
jgi:glyoxylase-like metal-dependent hydrolase (beta-lactamase superfamily II)